MQDASKGFLYHRVGLTEDDWQYSYYVLRNITFFATKSHCSRIQKSYGDFLKGMGFTYLKKQRDEEILLNGRYKEVIAYEGELPENVTIKGHHPNLIRGYSSEQKSKDISYQESLNHKSIF
uniref:HSF_DOMAIN domain-containing protein n=1 Tax=Angiostrongylus cantonensis TaxID=6313 RepID=A0A0K0D076_ANGCA